MMMEETNIFHKKKLKTGDVLIFSGTGVGAKAVQSFTKSKKSHISVVWKCPITKFLYSWETGETDFGSGPIISRELKNKDDAHLTMLQTKILNGEYTGEVYVHRLKNKNFYNFDDIETKMTNYIVKHIGTLYNYNIVPGWVLKHTQSMLHLTDFNFINLTLSNSLICSELVLKTLQYCDILDINKNVDLSAFYPCDFTEINQYFKMKNGFYFEKEELIYDRKNNIISTSFF